MKKIGFILKVGLIGAALVAVYLYGSRDGGERITRLRETLGERGKDLGHAVETATDFVQDKAAYVQEKASGLVDRAGETARSAVDVAVDRVDSAMDRVETMSES